RRHTRFSRDWSSDVCSSDLGPHTVFALGGNLHGLASSLQRGQLVGPAPRIIPCKQVGIAHSIPLARGGVNEGGEPPARASAAATPPGAGPAPAHTPGPTARSSAGRPRRWGGTPGARSARDSHGGRGIPR